MIRMTHVSRRPAGLPASAFTVTPELLTAQQVADVLSVSTRTLWRMVARGKLPPPIRWNRKLVRWHRDTLEQFLAGLFVDASQPG